MSNTQCSHPSSKQLRTEESICRWAFSAVELGFHVVCGFRKIFEGLGVHLSGFTRMLHQDVYAAGDVNVLEV